MSTALNCRGFVSDILFIFGLPISATYSAAKAFMAAEKINCLGLWRSRISHLEGVGGRKAARSLIQRARCGAHERQLINSAAMAWRPIYCTHPLQTMKVQSIVTFNIVQGPDPCKGGSVVMNKRDKRTGTGHRLNTKGGQRERN
jgi:hypothetical protein